MTEMAAEGNHALDSAAGAAVLPETIPVRDVHRFDTARLASMLAQRLGARLDEVRQMRGGQSNPTFLLATDRGEYVLRKQPNGQYIAAQSPVTLGDTVENAYSITSGLKAGDQVVVSSTQFLVNGMPVSPLPGA